MKKFFFMGRFFVLLILPGSCLGENDIKSANKLNDKFYCRAVLRACDVGEKRYPLIVSQDSVGGLCMVDSGSKHNAQDKCESVNGTIVIGKFGKKTWQHEQKFEQDAQKDSKKIEKSLDARADPRQQVAETGVQAALSSALLLFEEKVKDFL